MRKDRTLFPALLLLLGSLFTTNAFPADPPFLNFDDNTFGRKHVLPKPRPFRNWTQVSVRTSIYLEVLVPDTNGPLGAVDADTITVTLAPAGGPTVPLLNAGQQFAPGYTGSFFHGIDRNENNGEAVYIVPDAPLDPSTTYTVQVYAETLNGVPIDSALDSWPFTTRGVITNPTVSWSVNLDAPTVHWNGWFFTGILKPNFDTSRMFDQYDSYDLMDTVTAINPKAWSLQRDWPLTSDFWHNGVFDGNPNPMREQETRQIISMENRGQRTVLTVKDIEEGPLYGIPPNRLLGNDYHPGDQVTIGDRTHFEVAEVISVDEAKNQVKVTQLSSLAYDLDYPGSHPADNPDTPDNFTFPLCYLRKFNPVGTPVYYWTRIDDEWDVVHGQHGRRLQVNFSYIPLDLSREPVPASTGGHGSISPPKDYLEWHEFVRQLTFHLIDRYGAATLDFYWSIGNEHNFSIFWNGTKDDWYEYYDHTANAILTAFEDRGLDPNQVQVGGGEAAGLGGVGWTRDALYHMSGGTDKPGGGIAEQNFVCAKPEFDLKRAARVNALCAANGGKGSPFDFVSLHEYERTDQAISDLNAVRADALNIDPVFFNDLNVTSFESTPDWIPREDPANHAIYRGNGYFPTWCADWMERLVETAETDARYARHEAVLTVWPYDYNGQGISAVTGLMRVDDDGDGVQDRIATYRKAVFNYIERLAYMSTELDALPVRTVAGFRVSGVRSRSADTEQFLLYSHDMQDTESRDNNQFDARLSLSGIPWSATTVRRWRVDKDHSSPYRALQALPPRDSNAVYTPAEIADLEAQDDLVEDGPSQDYDTSDGTLEFSAPVLANGVTFLELRERDLDGDGLGDTADNCPGLYNPAQVDLDADGAGAVCDCNDGDSTVQAEPAEVAGLVLSRDGAGVTWLDWVSQASTAGSGTVYDGADGFLDELTADGGFDRAACLLSGAGEPPVSDPGADPPSSRGRYFLVRGRNVCATGTWGARALTPDPCP